jgi:glutamate transport system substrate-binding protein
VQKLVSIGAGVALVGVMATACGSSQAAPGTSAGVQTSKVDQTAAVAAGPVGKDLPNTPTIARIRQRGSMVFAGSHSGIGFSLLDPTTGKVSGFDEGMAELLAKYILGKPSVDLRSGGSDTREALIANHTVDVAVETYTITTARAKLVNFAGPYYMAASGIVVPKTDTGITKPSDLAGKKVATESGAAKDALLAEVPTAQPVLFDTTVECLAAVQQHRADAATLNTATLTGAVTKTPDLKLLDATYGSSPFGIGLPKDDPRFKVVVNQFLQTIETDGVWQKLWQDTVGKISSAPMPTPPKIGSVPGS